MINLTKFCWKLLKFLSKEIFQQKLRQIDGSLGPSGEIFGTFCWHMEMTKRFPLLNNQKHKSHDEAGLGGFS